MTADIVKRLRSEAMSWFPHTTPRHPIPTLINEAADEIERLRGLLAQVVEDPHSNLPLELLADIYEVLADEATS